MVSNQKLEEQKEELKYMSFEEINPLYSYIFASWETLDEETKERSYALIHGDSHHCVLGEAWKGDGTWGNDRCRECSGYGSASPISRGFPSVFTRDTNGKLSINYEKLERLKEEFVQHWNGVHNK